jgi:hypothetical protein
LLLHNDENEVICIDDEITYHLNEHREIISIDDDEVEREIYEIIRLLVDEIDENDYSHTDEVDEVHILIVQVYEQVLNDDDIDELVDILLVIEQLIHDDEVDDNRTVASELDDDVDEAEG